jgi:regulator of sigma E protease
LKGLGKDKHGTLFSLNFIPFGGFVRMFGEDSHDPALRHAPGSFGSKSIAARTLIILGGVLMNFLLGYVILVWLFSVGTKPFIISAEDFRYYREKGFIDATEQVVIMDFVEGSPAAKVDKAGLKLEKGDVIVEIDGVAVKQTEDVIANTTKKAGESVQVKILREIPNMSKAAKPGDMRKTEILFDVPVNAEGKMGISIADVPDVKEIREISYPFPRALAAAGYETARLTGVTMKMFVKVMFDLFTKFELSKQVSGPVGIAQITHETTQNGSFAEILKLIALLSISLGAINALPIPALDGGRFLSIAFEVLARRRPSMLWEARIHAFGFVLLILLILAVTYQDIVKLLTGS